MVTHNAFKPPYPGGHGVDPCWTGNPCIQENEKYVTDDSSLTFPGPLLSGKMEKEDLLAFILKKSQETLLHVEEPEHMEAYFFWQLMELQCNCNGKALMAEIAARLFKVYRILRRKVPKLVCGKGQGKWCLRLAKLLCFAAPEDDVKNAVIQMADDLANNGQIFASHICCVLAQLELGSYTDFSFDLIGCESFPFKKSDIRNAIERSEVYEYVLFMASGSPQLKFQKYKTFHAGMLAKEGHSALALDYFEVIVRAVATSPSCVKMTLMKHIIQTSEKFLRRKTEEPEWIRIIRRLHAEREEENNNIVFLSEPKSGEEDFRFTGFKPFQFPEIPVFQPAPVQLNTTAEEEFVSRYIVGELLGKGGFGSVYAGIRKADGKMVAIKYVVRSASTKYITIPGETDSLPLEVALMKMVSVPPCSDFVVELLDWFETPSNFILVLERPSPCMDLFEFCKLNGGLPESLACKIMWQVVQAARHCCEHQVLHRDIKPENILINTKTMQVKLIDFGCGDLLKDTPYTRFAGTPAYWPPEWILERECKGRPATVWSLGVLLYFLIYRDYPFKNEHETAYKNIQLHPSLSRKCKHLILCCLDKDPSCRETLENIMNHGWFTEERYAQKLPGRNIWY